MKFIGKSALVVMAALLAEGQLFAQRGAVAPRTTGKAAPARATTGATAGGYTTGAPGIATGSATTPHADAVGSGLSNANGVSVKQNTPTTANGEIDSAIAMTNMTDSVELPAHVDEALDSIKNTIDMTEMNLANLIEASAVETSVSWTHNPEAVANYENVLETTATSVVDGKYLADAFVQAVDAATEDDVSEQCKGTDVGKAYQAAKNF